MWQALYEKADADDFVVLAVAEESRGAETARPWIEAANPGFPCLIDTEHHVADLYNMVNVPQAVWIDEEGRIVRPAENAGAHDGWRAMNREDMSLPDEVAELMGKAQATYMDAVLDWAKKGAASRHAFDPDAARAHAALPDADVALANACFRLGKYLLQHGKETEGSGLLERASELRPDSWNIYRQAMNLREIGPDGYAADEAFFARADALGKERYYPPPDIEGFPTELGFEPPGD